MTASIILRCNDSKSVEFARETIGTHFEEYTGHVEREQIGDRSVATNRETRVEEQHEFAAGDFLGLRRGRRWSVGRARD